nr:LytR C-terminal domain-containing protein [Schaalia odontolytica]
MSGLGPPLLARVDTVSTPNAPRPALTPRQRFLRERQQRQNTTFAVIGIAMIVAAVAAALVFTGIVPVPFGNDFSVKVKYAETGDIPCPTADAKPVAPSQVTVTVINTTQHQGLASKATDMLSTAGFKTEEPANSDTEYTGKVRITARADSVDAAYSVARFFPGSHVRLSDAEDATVTVELGTFYDDTMSAEDVQRVLKSNDSIEQPAKCRPMSGTKQD